MLLSQLESCIKAGPISTCVLCLTDCVSTERGPVWNSSSSFLRSSSSLKSDFGFLGGGGGNA